MVVSTSSTTDNGLTPLHIGSYAIGLDGGAGQGELLENWDGFEMIMASQNSSLFLAEGDEDYAVGAADAVEGGGGGVF